MRKLIGLAVCLVLGVGLALSATQAHQAPAGNWKVAFIDGHEVLTLWHLKLEAKDGKYVATIDPAPKVPAAAVSEVALKGDILTLSVEFQGQVMKFALKVPKGDAKRLSGMMTFNGTTYAAQLEATK